MGAARLVHKLRHSKADADARQAVGIQRRQARVALQETNRVARGDAERLIQVGIDAHGSTPEEMRDRMAADIQKWAAVIEKAGIEKQ